MEKYPSIPLAPRFILHIQVVISLGDTCLGSLFKIEILLIPILHSLLLIKAWECVCGGVVMEGKVVGCDMTLWVV